MEYNGKELEVIGYLYSTDTVNLTTMDSTGTGTKYVNEPSVIRTFTWKLAIQVTEFCDTSILAVKQIDSDPLAEISHGDIVDSTV